MLADTTTDLRKLTLITQIGRIAARLATWR
jgi:hypothetical protein